MGVPTRSRRTRTGRLGSVGHRERRARAALLSRMRVGEKDFDHERFRGQGETTVGIIAVHESTRGLLSTVSISPAEQPVELLDPRPLAGGASLHA